jgi:hypothetical protein
MCYIFQVQVDDQYSLSMNRNNTQQSTMLDPLSEPGDLYMKSLMGSSMSLYANKVRAGMRQGL